MSTNTLHTTNYFDTFIAVADDIKVHCGTVPRSKAGNKSIAELQYELLVNNPYQFTSDDVLFQVFAIRNELTVQESVEARCLFFSKGQPCFRSSPLTKVYGFGVHANSDGKIAIYGMETEQYQCFLNNRDIKTVKAMRSSKNK